MEWPKFGTDTTTLGHSVSSEAALAGVGLPDGRARASDASLRGAVPYSARRPHLHDAGGRVPVLRVLVGDFDPKKEALGLTLKDPRATGEGAKEKQTQNQHKKWK